MAAAGIGLVACGGSKTSDYATVSSVEAAKTDKVISFSADSAMSYLRMQVDCGPRVPGTEGHARCAQQLESMLREWADTVDVHTTTVTAWNGDRLPLRNIRARFGTGLAGRPVLLIAHWDTRPWADAQFPGDDTRHPIDGANDGASGVAVLLEVARQSRLNGVSRSFDILLVDGEDYGAPEHVDAGEDTWCLGTQQWIADGELDRFVRPEYAILLDMVGGRNAIFNREYLSDGFARQYVDRVWRQAASIGLGERFSQSRGGAVVDDHLYLNRAGIPAIDIIECANPETGSFNPTWHTLGDNIENIDPATLEAVGRLISSLTVKQGSDNGNN